MSSNSQASKLQIAIHDFVLIAVQNECVKNNQQVMAAMRVLFHLVGPCVGTKIDPQLIKDDIQYLHARIVGENAPVTLQIEEVALFGENKLCETLIARIERMIETAPEEDIIPHVEKLERIAVQPAHKNRLNFFKRALGIATTTGE
mgnify:CR=1 FL=1